MSISNQTIRHEYVASVGQTTFPYQFKIYAATDLHVYVNTSLKAYGFYSVSGVGSDNGGNVIFSSPLAGGETVVILSAMPMTQPYIFTPNSNLDEKSIENGLDRTTRLAQQNKEALNRVLMMPEYSLADAFPIDDITGKANRYLKIDNTGTKGEWVLPGSSEVFTASTREYFVASASQTVFTTDTQYNPGIGHLHVHVNGIRQIVNVAYTETSTHTFTFVEGLNAGDEVEAVFAAYTNITAINSDSILYAAAGANTISRTVRDKLREDAVSVLDFGNNINDGTTIALTAIRNAFTASKRVHFPEGTYNLGTLSNTTVCFNFSSMGDNIRVTTEGRVVFKLHTSTTPNDRSYLFYFRNNSHVHFDEFYVEDTGGAAVNIDNPSIIGGCTAVYNINLGTDAVTDHHFEGVHTTGCLAAVIYANPYPTWSYRTDNIRIDRLTSINGYYGFNCQNDGDHVTIGSLVASRNYRPYFVYGCMGHDVNMFNSNPRVSTGQCLIARHVGSLDTFDINVNYHCKNIYVDGTHVSFQHVDLLGGIIQNCKVHIGITDSTSPYTACNFLNYTGGGGSTTTASSNNHVRGIYLSGSCEGNARRVSATATYAARGMLQMQTGYYFTPEQSVYDAFQLTQQTRNASVNWTSVGTQPTLGNGTLTHNIDIDNGMAQITFTLVFGSTTSGGTGAWKFDGFNYGPSITTLGTWLGQDVGGNWWCGVARWTVGGVIELFYNDQPNAVSSTIPFTWATGDNFICTIQFPLS